MADERGFWDRILEGVDLSDYDPREWSGEDIWNTISPFAISETGRGEDEAVAARNARWAAANPAEREKIRQEQREAGAAETLRRASLPTEKPFMSVSRTDAPRSKATPMPTREDIISRLLASGRGPTITQGGGSPQTRPTSRVGTSKASAMPTREDIISRLLAPKRGEYPPRTTARTPPSMGLEFGDVKGLSPSNVRTTAARREAATLKNKVIADAARKKRAAEARKVSTLLKERQASPSKADIRSGRQAETKRKAAKEKAREISLEKSAKKIGKEFRQPKVTPISKPKPKVVSEKKPKVVSEKKVAKKKTTPIQAALGTGRKAHTVKSGQTLSGIAKQHGTTLKALLAANPKLKGRPNLIKVGEKIKIRGPLKKASSPYKGMTKKEWEKITTASQKQREQRSARKKGGIVKKAGGGKMKQVGLHTAEMRSGGKDLHQPQSKIKKRIHQETTYAKKGGKVGKKKQGYKARKDESIAMRVKKKRTKKQLKASRNESYGKWGKGKGKGKINRSGAALVAASYD